jgi:plastocyanin
MGRRALAHAGRFLLVAMIAAPAASCARRPALHRVTMQRVAFEPAALGVAAGDTVEWDNRDLVPHTTTATSGAWDSKVIEPNASWRTVIAARGDQAYACTLHPTMKGRITVR